MFALSKRNLLYLTVADEIKEDILQGVYPVGTNIPTERELEERFSVSKITVRNAIEILSNEGYVEKKSGVGTKVISDRLFNKLSKARSFSAILEEKHNLKKEVIFFGIVDSPDDGEVKRLFGEQSYLLERTYELDQKPYIYFEHYFPIVDSKATIKSIENQSLYKWLADSGMEVAYFQDAFKVARMNAKLKMLLDTRATHVLCRVRKTFDRNDRVIEISYGYYDSEMSPYIIEYEV